MKKRKDGRYMTSFRDASGRRHYVYGYTISQLKEKEMALRIQLMNSPVVGSYLTLDRYFETWEKTRVGQVTQSTAYNCRKRYGVISRYLGKQHLRDIDFTAVSNFQQALQTDDVIRKGNHTGRLYRPRTIDEEIALLSSILKSAAEERLILSNPCTRLKKIRDLSGRSIKDGSHRALGVSELKRFMKEAEPSWYYDMFVLLSQTGIRAGEAGALAWADVDLKKRTVLIHRTLEQKADHEWIVSEVPKTNAGLRRIRLSDEAVDALGRQKEKMTAEFGEDAVTDSSLIFLSQVQGYVIYKLVNTAIRTVVKRMNRSGGKFKIFSSHAFRHTFATRCVQQGMKPEVLKGILGHSDISVTLNTYYHLEQKVADTAMDRVKIPIR